MSAPRRELAIVLGLALGPAVALGLARFAYALLLPTMRTTLGWSFATAGLVNTANALGYLLGALVAAPLGHRLGARRAFLGGITATGLALVASAATTNLALLSGLRLVAGAAGAVIFIVGGGLVARTSQGQRSGRAALLLGVYFGGAGLGILLSGVIIGPLLASAGDTTGWRWGWLALGSLTLLSLLGAVPATRAAAPPETARAGTPFPRRTLAALAVSYLLFGVGYIAYMTFIVAYLHQQGARDTAVDAFWAILGAAAVAGGFAWGPVLGRLRGGRGPAVVMAVVTVGAALPLFSGGTSTLLPAFVSSVLFGGSFLAVVTSVTAVARLVLAPSQWTAAIGELTVVFAAGQCLGPVLAGVASDGPGGVRAGMLLSAAVLAVGAVVALAQPLRSSPCCAPSHRETWPASGQPVPPPRSRP